MKILIFGGAGKIGSAAAWDLANVDSVEKIGLVGRHKDTLDSTKKWINSEKIVLHQADIHNKDEITKIMKQYDAGIIALPDRKTSYRLADTAINAGLHIVDMLEEYHRRPDLYELEGLELPSGLTLEKYGDYLHETAIKNDIIFLDGMGFAPGLSNITCGEGIRKLNKAESAIARVGGIPNKNASEKHPLKYMITWAFHHVLREYMVKLNVIQNGKITEVEATTGREKFIFNRLGNNEELECAITPGMPSFIYSRPQLLEFAEKTVRWPGHWSGVDTLKECGLLNIEPQNYNGSTFIPRDILLSLIEPKLRANPGETDVCVMFNTVKGTLNNKPAAINYYMWEEADTGNNISGMARVTGYPSAIGAVMICTDRNGKNGIVPPEDFFEGELYTKFMAELKKRDINILEEQTILSD